MKERNRGDHQYEVLNAVLKQDQKAAKHDTPKEALLDELDGERHQTIAIKKSDIGTAYGALGLIYGALCVL